MTDRPPGADAPRPDDVRRSLRALADGSAPSRGRADEAASTSSPCPGAIVRDAERAARCARAAAALLSAGRLPELDRALAAAARRGDDDVVARGRAARQSLKRLDAALSGSEAAASGPGGDAVATGNHFHSGRGTVLRDTAQEPGR